MVVLAKLSFSIPLLDVENLETINGRNPLNLRCLHTANISVSMYRGGGRTGAAGAFAPVKIWQQVQCTRLGV